jgi:hypothetical protein
MTKQQRTPCERVWMTACISYTTWSSHMRPARRRRKLCPAAFAPLLNNRSAQECQPRGMPQLPKASPQIAWRPIRESTENSSLTLPRSGSRSLRRDSPDRPILRPIRPDRAPPSIARRQWRRRHSLRASPQSIPLCAQSAGPVPRYLSLLPASAGSRVSILPAHPNCELLNADSPFASGD